MFSSSNAKVFNEELEPVWSDGTMRQLAVPSTHLSLTALSEVVENVESKNPPRSMSSASVGLPIRQWCRLVSAISASNVNMERVGKSLEETQEDLFMKRFSTRNVHLVSTKPPTYCEFEGLRSGQWRRPVSRIEHFLSFLKSSVVHPDGVVIFYWLAVLSLAVFYNWWVLIAREAYEELESRYRLHWFSMDLIADLLYLTDMLIQFRTGYLEQGLLVTNAKKICRKYMCSLSFFLDLTSLVPTELIVTISGFNYHPLIRFPRLIKTYRVLVFYYMIETRAIYPNLIRVMNLTHILLMSCHWFACFHFMLARHTHFKTRWISENWLKGNTSINDLSTTRKYLLSLYWSTLTLTTIGNTASPKTDLE